MTLKERVETILPSESLKQIRMLCISLFVGYPCIDFVHWLQK